MAQRRESELLEVTAEIAQHRGHHQRADQVDEDHRRLGQQVADPLDEAEEAAEALPGRGIGRGDVVRDQRFRRDGDAQARDRGFGDPEIRAVLATVGGEVACEATLSFIIPPEGALR